MARRLPDSIPLHDPLYLHSLMVEESMAYRQRVQRRVNWLRLVLASVALLVFVLIGKLPQEGLSELLHFTSQYR